MVGLDRCAVAVFAAHRRHPSRTEVSTAGLRGRASTAGDDDPRGPGGVASISRCGCARRKSGARMLAGVSATLPQGPDGAFHFLAALLRLLAKGMRLRNWLLAERFARPLRPQLRCAAGSGCLFRLAARGGSLRWKKLLRRGLPARRTARLGAAEAGEGAALARAGAERDAFYLPGCGSAVRRHRQRIHHLPI